MPDKDYWPLIAVAGMLLLVLLFAVYLLRRRGRKLTLPRVAKNIAVEWKQNLVLPDGLDGEIQIDHLMLTCRGLLVLDLKEVEGNIFGGNRMDEWTVIGSDRRYTFRNPQAMIFDKVSAVKRYVPDIPVIGYILFTGQAHFKKGRPEGVITLPELNELYAPVAGTDQVLHAFRPHWERLLMESSAA
ncbi:MAG: NERD domain-containing protein [Gammaproteobacteria bacterium]|jgi:hypothetical protein|nr:NERD domain-containing protein [Gammaproteobacteria bacterium]